MRIYGHRGLPGPDATENTTAAVRAALAAGADGVEVDLRLTADDALVVCHDLDLFRLVGSPLSVAATDAATLGAVRLPCGSPLARLTDVLDLVGARPVILELKHASSTPYGTQRAARALVAALRERVAASPLGPVTVSSFDAGILAAVASLRSSGVPIRLALLGTPAMSVDLTARTAQAHGADEIHPAMAAVERTPAAVAAARARGLGVVPWTVNDPGRIALCQDAGVTGVITDAPLLARRVVGDRVLSEVA